MIIFPSNSITIFLISASQNFFPTIKTFFAIDKASARPQK